MKERERERADKPDQAVVEGRPSGSGGSRLGTVRWQQILCFWSRDSLFSLGLGSEEG